MSRITTFDNLNENTKIHKGVYVAPFKKPHLAEKCAPKRSKQYNYAIYLIYLYDYMLHASLKQHLNFSFTIEIIL